MINNSSILPANTNNSRYVGRFAPSPSGNLHFGSLITATASYLIARQQNGKWLLRIDDIDAPRCKAGMDTHIMHTLEAHGLFWDGEVMYQSTRLPVYESVLQRLQDGEFAYFCQCTRKQIKAKGEFYSGTCANLRLSGEGLAVRLRNPKADLTLTDKLLGDIVIPEQILHEDFVLKRRDGVFGYHLVAVIDDIEQGISQVVRGADLLLPSACQLLLYDLLGARQPEFLHVPVAVSEPGKKLSKQNHSPVLNNKNAAQNLISALAFLGARGAESLSSATPLEILQWAKEHWRWQDMEPTRELVVDRNWC